MEEKKRDERGVVNGDTCVEEKKEMKKGKKKRKEKKKSYSFFFLAKRNCIVEKQIIRGM